MRRPPASFVILVSLLLTVIPAASGSADSAIYRGTLFPLEAIRVEDVLVVPDSQAFSTLWRLDPASRPTFRSDHLTVYVDEWRWTGPLAADAPGSTPPDAAVHTHSEQRLAEARVRVVKQGPANEWALSASRGGAVLFASYVSGCSIAVGPPQTVAYRGAATSLAPGVAFDGRLQETPAARSLLHVACERGGLNFTIPGRSERTLSPYDVQLQIQGVEDTARATRILNVESGAFREPSATFPLYDNLVRHVTLRPEMDAAGGASIQLDSARQVRFQTPVLQAVGTIVIPPFVGALTIAGQRIENATQSIVATGAFLLLANGNYRTLYGVEVAGSSMDHDPAAGVSLRRATDGVSPVLIAAGLGVLLLSIGLGKWLVSRMVPAAGLFTRLTSSLALAHPVRRTIHEFLVHNPGTRLQVAAQALGVNESTFRHHVRILLDGNLIQVRKEGKKLCLFPRPKQVLDPDKQLALILRQDVIAQRILHALRDQDIKGQSRLAKLAGVSQSYASRLLRKMEEAGLVVRRPRAGGRGTTYARAA